MKSWVDRVVILRRKGEVRNLKDKKCMKWFMDMVIATVVSRTENYGVVFVNGGRVN